MRECFLEAHKARIRSDLELGVLLSIEIFVCLVLILLLLSQLELDGHLSLCARQSCCSRAGNHWKSSESTIGA